MHSSPLPAPSWSGAWLSTAAVRRLGTRGLGHNASNNSNFGQNRPGNPFAIDVPYVRLVRNPLEGDWHCLPFHVPHFTHRGIKREKTLFQVEEREWGFLLLLSRLSAVHIATQSAWHIDNPQRKDEMQQGEGRGAVWVSVHLIIQGMRGIPGGEEEHRDIQWLQRERQVCK
jgi:hypothetical protein